MIRRRFLSVVLGALLVLVSCGPTTTDTSSDTGTDSTTDSTTSSDISTSTDTTNPEVLSSPVISLNVDNTGLVWSEVPHASSYELKVNDGDYAAATSYLFSDTV
ncbi:MAG: hypothetical protein WCW63_02910, partial [Acholeplasmataceae bacterium]